tara:strand:- start:956 stop:1552 length:597 start_codon:yes stop_codon:yes gene_type:complete
MAISYPVDIQPLQEQGVSNAEIAAHLSDRTAVAIANADARTELQESGAVIIDPSNPTQRSGSLIDFYATLPAGQNATLVAWFINAVFGTSDDINTQDYPRSIQFAQVELILPSGLQPVAASLVDGAGGRPDPGTTEADVVAIQAQYEADQAAAEATAAQLEKYNGLYNANISPLVTANEPDNAKWQAALNKMAADWAV